MIIRYNNTIYDITKLYVETEFNEIGTEIIQYSLIGESYHGHGKEKHVITSSDDINNVYDIMNKLNSNSYEYATFEKSYKH